ncbi:hypothetical protein CKO35_01850 [Ectothiorhodospira shaposhnikovii]|uniref:DUF2939 domain-containing protein n=1 Tax=Ectothiorhodospira shaposhnikovii TaxID=1054 RepID=UPI0019087261|nr:DUF2939 domain-containing protein [Ectothiorhodospira shaposhnikovii]MBK1672060.1 hypothetical protein [Ectothiorhodospira shaposhnikovii]
MKMLIKPLVIAGLLALGGWYYYAPYHTVSQMQAAVESRDADKLARHVNFPALREDVRQTLNQVLAQELADFRRDNPFGGLGVAVAGALLKPLVDAVVSPAGISTIMEGYIPEPDGRGMSFTSQGQTRTRMGYSGLDRFVVTMQSEHDPLQQVDLVLVRQGTFSWKLAALRFPWAE